MGKSFDLVKATHHMLEEIQTIYLNCRENLLENGIFQWDDQYPNKDYFKECIEQNDLYVFKIDAAMIGHVVLNEWESTEWEIISWEGKNPIILHSLMINPIFQEKGLGLEFVKLCENFAKKKMYDSIRLDAFSGNKKALHLYTKLGYENRGSVFFNSKPVGHQEYICFEKML